MNISVLIQRRLASEYSRLLGETQKMIALFENDCEHHKNRELLNPVAENWYLCSECGASVKIGRDWT